MILKEELINYIYLKSVLNWSSVRKYYERFAGGGLQINLGKQDLLSLEIMLPPRDLQDEFKNKYEMLLDYKNKLESCIKTDLSLIESLTQRAFRGELIKQTEAA